MGKKVLATVLACVLMLMSFNIASTALSMEHSEKNLSKEVLLNQFNRTAPQAELLSSTQTATVSTFNELQTAVNNPDVIWIYIANDIQMEDTLTVNRSIVLSALNSKVNLRAPNRLNVRHFNVSGREIQLIFAQVVLSGGRNENEELISGGIFSTATHLIIRNAEITNCYNENQGGAVYCLNSGQSVTLFDCHLNNNEAHWGGALYGTRVFLYDSQILNNKAYIGGGIQSTYELYMENSYITNNTADSTGGGAVFHNKAEIKNSTISYNTATGGGGIYCGSFKNTEFKILDSVISYNSAKVAAGIEIPDVTADNSVVITLDLTGTEIFENNAMSSGGGLRSYLSKNDNRLIVIGGEFRDNSITTGSGAGIYAVKIELTDCKIISNVCNKYGGGIYGKEVTLNSGVVIDSNQASQGAGVFSENKLTVSNGVFIQNNTAQLYGGGIYGKEIAILGGTVQDNQSGRNGGGIYGSTVMLINGDITSNHCDEYGGGIYVESDGTLVLFGGSVSNNTAGIDGNDTYKA